MYACLVFPQTQRLRLLELAAMSAIISHEPLPLTHQSGRTGEPAEDEGPAEFRHQILAQLELEP